MVITYYYIGLFHYYLIITYYVINSHYYLLLTVELADVLVTENRSRFDHQHEQHSNLLSNNVTALYHFISSARYLRC